MARSGTVLGHYLVAVQRFVIQLDLPEDAARFGDMAESALDGDGTALVAFLHAARRCLSAYDAPEDVWEWHERALAIVIDLLADGAMVDRIDADLLQGLRLGYGSAGGVPTAC